MLAPPPPPPRRGGGGGVSYPPLLGISSPIPLGTSDAESATRADFRLVYLPYCPPPTALYLGRVPI